MEERVMKKYFCNIFALAALLMAGAAFTACSSDDNSIEQPANPVGEKTYTLTINASKGANASTRALKLETSGALTAYWENGDVLTVFNVTKNAALTGSLTAKNANGGTATFSGSLTGTIEKDDVLALSYHQPTGMSDYSAQAGTLASAAARDYAIAQVTVASVEDGNITTTDDASFQTQTAMLKLTLEDGDKNKLNATQLKVSATMTISPMPAMTEDLATFNLTDATYTANGAGILYFALPNKATVAGALVTKIKATVPSEYQSLVTTEAVTTALNGATLTYTATVGGNTYIATKTNGYPFAAAKYYAGTLTMSKPAAAAYTMAANAVAGTDEGKLICTDGHIHAYGEDAECTKDRVAMIAYVGSSTGDATYNHGLALALTDESSSGMNWNAANTACTNKNTSATVESASWMLPSRTQWETMGATSSTYTTLRNGFTSVGGSNLQSGYYWSSTGVASYYAWSYSFDIGGWRDGSKDNAYLRVRACLAF